MLIQEGSAFFGVARHAHLEIRLLQKKTVRRSVRLVAIGALDLTLRNTMMCRQRELRLNRFVAPEAQIRLLLLEHAFAKPPILLGPLRQLEELRLGEFGLGSRAHRDHQVCRVALIARDPHELVFGAIEQPLVRAAVMAVQAAIRIFRWLALEAENQLLSSVGVTRRHRLDVRLAWTVAGLATDS